MPVDLDALSYEELVDLEIAENDFVFQIESLILRDLKIEDEIDEEATAFLLKNKPGLEEGSTEWDVELERKKEEILAALVYGRIIFLAVLCLMGLGFLLADLPRGVERAHEDGHEPPRGEVVGELVVDQVHRLVDPRHGDTVDELLRYVEFEPKRLLARYREKLNRAGLGGAERAACLQALEGGLTGTTYLEDE